MSKFKEGFMTAWNIEHKSLNLSAGIMVRRPDLEKYQFYAFKDVEFNPITLTGCATFREWEMEVLDMPEGVNNSDELLEFLIKEVEEKEAEKLVVEKVQSGIERLVIEKLAEKLGIGAKAYVGQFDEEKYRDCFAILPGPFSDDQTIRIYFDRIEGRELDAKEIVKEEGQNVVFIPFPAELEGKGTEEKVKFLLGEIDASVAVNCSGEIMYSNKVDPTNN